MARIDPNHAGRLWPGLSGQGWSRRQFLRQLVGLMLAVHAAPQLCAQRDPEPSPSPRYCVGVCDWMILQRQKVRAFSLARELGADGVEVDLGPLGQRETFDNALARPEVRQQFLEAARQHQVALCSLAMSGFYAQSFAERPTVPRMIEDAVQTAEALGVRVLFLPLGVQSDLVRHPHLRPAVVERLRWAGRRAERAGLCIGVETSLPAAEEVGLLEEVGSPAVRSYFNFAQAIRHGRDVVAELETLGPDRILQIHATNEDGVRLEEDPQLDLRRIRRSLDRMGWRGWLVVERTRDARDPRNIRANFGANVAFLKRVFQDEPAP